MAEEQFTKKECKLLLEAFTNWMDTDYDTPWKVWTDDGKAVNPDYQALIEKLKRR